MSTVFDYDYIVIGSGFGGSVSACRLNEKGYSVAVIEMGKRFTAETLPKTSWETRRHIWRPGLKMFGFFNIRFFRHIMIFTGNAVGGGSYTYAGVSLPAPDKVWEQGTWAGLKDWKSILPKYYATAERMLGVAKTAILGDADLRLKKMAELEGVGDKFQALPAAVFFGPEGGQKGKTYPDPYFGGEGPDRASCIGCGGCMMGCPHNAKNTLDKNYLYLAEKRGARIYDERQVTDIRPIGKADGSEGYEIHTERSTAWFTRERRVFRACGIVLAAGALGSTELLLRLKDGKSLPRLSNALGKRVLTNSEALVGIRFPKGDGNMALGVAGGSEVYLDDETHVEVARFPVGSDAISPLMTVLGGGKSRFGRIFLWLWFLLSHPFSALRVHIPKGFAKQSMLLIVMTNDQRGIEMKLRRPWYWPFAKKMDSYGKPLATYIEKADAFIRKGAKALGGTPITTLTDVLFDLPSTGHCMGGCAMAGSPEHGVVDANHRVFGYENMLICDGSVLSANLGVNPSLTITALTELAMSSVPARATAQHGQLPEAALSSSETGPAFTKPHEEELLS